MVVTLLAKNTDEPSIARTKSDHHECRGLHILGLTVINYARLSSLKNANNSLEYSKVFDSCFDVVKKTVDTQTEVNGPDLLPALYKLRGFLKDNLEKREILDDIILSWTQYD